MLIRHCQPSGKKVVLCYGMFNARHNGHIHYLKQSEASGDSLVAVITKDRYSGGNPDVHCQAHSAEALAHLYWIDAVSVNTCEDWQTMIRDLKPDIYAKGLNRFMRTIP